MSKEPVARPDDEGQYEMVEVAPEEERKAFERRYGKGKIFPVQSGPVVTRPNQPGIIPYTPTPEQLAGMTLEQRAGIRGPRGGKVDIEMTPYNPTPEQLANITVDPDAGIRRYTPVTETKEEENDG